MDKVKHEAILKQILESTDSETTLNLMQELRADNESTEQRVASISSETESKINEWKERYERTRQDYIDRFFSNPAEVKKNQEEDTKDDASPKTFEQLFKNREDK